VKPWFAGILYPVRMKSTRAGLSAAGAVLAAVLASACCIGPALLAIAGIGGAATIFALGPYRPLLMTLAFVLLVCGFYLARRRSRDCCADERGPAASAGRGTRAILWIATLFVVLLAGSSLFMGGFRPRAADDLGAAGRAGAEAAARTATLAIEGMTCAGCVARVEEKLGEVSGVTTYEVSLERKEARVSYDPAATTPEAIVTAVATTGFATSLKDCPALPADP